MKKRSYVSPPVGELEISVIRDANPRVEMVLDLGIPNFTVFSLKLPLIEGQPQAMSTFIAEALNALLDEAASFMISMEFSDEIIVQMYATVLTAFKGMSKESDSSKEQDETGADPIVRTFEGSFSLPMAFVNETQRKVVTGASKKLDTLIDKTNALLEEQITRTSRSKPESFKPIAEKAEALLQQAAPLFEKRSLITEENEMLDKVRFLFSSAVENFRRVRRILPSRSDYLADYVHNGLTDLKEALVRLRELTEVSPKNARGKKIERLPKVRHIELTYAPKPKTSPNDVARIITQYRNRSLKQQPKPLYVIVYDQMGRPTGTLPLGPKFKNQLLQLTKKSTVEFIPPLSFSDEQSLKGQLLPAGIPEAVSVGGMTYLPEAVAGQDMALYHGPQDYLVKFPDGRSAIFPGRPTFRLMRRLNFPVPRNRFKWTILLRQEEKPSIKPEEANADGAVPRG